MAVVLGRFSTSWVCAWGIEEVDLPCVPHSIPESPQPCGRWPLENRAHRAGGHGALSRLAQVAGDTRRGRCCIELQDADSCADSTKEAGVLSHLLLWQISLLPALTPEDAAEPRSDPHGRQQLSLGGFLAPGRSLPDADARFWCRHLARRFLNQT